MQTVRRLHDTRVAELAALPSQGELAVPAADVVALAEELRHRRRVTHLFVSTPQGEETHRLCCAEVTAIAERYAALGHETEAAAARRCAEVIREMSLGAQMT